MSKRPTIADAISSDKVEEFILQNPTIAGCVARIVNEFGMPLMRGGPISVVEIEQISRDPFLRKALQITLIRGILLEAFLTYLRRALLSLVSQNSDDDIVGLFCALAQQCFINEYTYASGDD